MSSIYSPYGGTPGKPCTRCGKPLPPNEVHCGNCGYHNAPPQGNGLAHIPSNASWGSNAPQSPYSAGQYGNQAWGQPPAPPDSAPQAFAPPKMFRLPSHSSSPTHYPNNHVSTPQPSSPVQPPIVQTGMGKRSGLLTQAMQNGSYSVPQQPAYPPPAPTMTGGFQTGGFSGTPSRGQAQRPEQKTGPNMPVLIGIIALLVVLVGGGTFGYIFLSHRSTADTAATTTLAPTPTPKVPPLFADTFANNANGWDLQGDPGKFSVAVTNSSLTLEDDDNKLLWELLPGGKTFSDFKLSVDTVLSKGDQNNGYGVYIRGASNQNTDLATYYRFELYGDGTYAVFKGIVDATGNSISTKLVDYTTSDAIHVQGTVNHIDIIAKGSAMMLVVNGQELKTITDSGYTSGSIALFVSNLQGSRPGAQATFSHFSIYPADA